LVWGLGRPGAWPHTLLKFGPAAEREHSGAGGRLSGTGAMRGSS